MILEVDDLSFAYSNGVQALQGVSLSVEAGEAVAIIGRNGSGKTTLVKHFNGLLTSQQGTVFVDGQPLGALQPAQLASTIGLVFQNPSDQIFLGRVWDEVAFGARQLGLRGGELEQRVAYALDVIDLGWAADTHPYDITLTDRKLVCLASVLATDPKVIVLDEPTTAQDQLGVRKLIVIIDQLLAQGKTVITISHDMEFVAEAFARTIVMRQGEILLDGDTRRVFSQRTVLESTAVKPPAISRLTERLGITQSLVTIKEFADWLESKTPSS